MQIYMIDTSEIFEQFFSHSIKRNLFYKTIVSDVTNNAIALT